MPSQLGQGKIFNFIVDVREWLSKPQKYAYKFM
jgi:hypothetical protein